MLAKLDEMTDADFAKFSEQEINDLVWALSRKGIEDMGPDDPDDDGPLELTAGERRFFIWALRRENARMREEKRSVSR